MANEHDKRYKKLFSNPLILTELMQHFVDEAFVKELDYSTLERMDKSFVTDTFREKESDIIYKINFRDKEIFIYLLIEFQSTEDKFMALRINRYITEFYEFLINDLKISELPAVFPILLYNGEKKWSASASLQDLIIPSLPEKYIPHLTYYKIIENEIPKEILLTINNAVSAIFYIENSQPEEIKNEFKKIITLIEKEHPQVILLFKRWLNNLFQTSKANWDADTLNDQIEDLMEVQVMFETALRERDQKMVQQGVQQGEHRKAIKAALKMLEHGLSIDLIADCTGLTEAEIEKLKQEQSH